ncbi:MAG: TolC family protein [Ramlibacter sp.]|nr:TolC family protein [Ramlibacter sp.]
MMRAYLGCTALAAALFLAGCAAVDVDQAVADVNSRTASFTRGQVQLDRSGAQADARARLAEALLGKPLSQDDAVQLALANSPALQALLADGWADLAAARQTGRMANPVFTFERVRSGDELELGRLLSFGLLDLLTLPRRLQWSESQADRVRTQLSAQVIGQVTEVRQAWVRAVAAQQAQSYADQVHTAAQAAAELARRMQRVGNFTRLQRLRQQAYYADSAARLAISQQAATAAREALVRQLGLTEAQAERLQLPEHLPDLPPQALPAERVRHAASGQRLDLQLARAQLDVAGQAQGLDLINSLTDVELGIRRDTVFDNASSSRTPRRGYELDIRLPVFDWGTARREAMNARSLAAARRYEAIERSASSQLRETYSAYRTAYDLARHYHDEVVPLRERMAEENVLRYNGMLIGVFELLADTREQIASVSAAIDAYQQFWLADAALAASMAGQPVGMALASPALSGGNETAGAGH